MGINKITSGLFSEKNLHLQESTFPRTVHLSRKLYNMELPNEELQELLEKECRVERPTGRYKICGLLLRSLKEFMRSWSLLKGFALVFGLWIPRRRLCALFALIFFLPDCCNILQSVIYAFVCPSVGSVQDMWYCPNNTRSISLPIDTSKTNLLSFARDLAQLFTHLAFFWSVWVLPKKEDAVGQGQTCSLVQPWGWVKLNSKILVFFCVLLFGTVWVLIDNPFSILYWLDFPFYPIPLWVSLLTCWIFGTLMSSLETLTTRCTNDITSSEHLDDVIKLHQKLCKIIFATSDALKYWFMIHWALYTVLCVVWVTQFVDFVHIVMASLSLFLSNILYLGIYVYVFIYPCYCAASVTEKCQQMLADFNMKDEKEWHETHPFRQREQLHLFLKYADYANCGYKVGNLRFGSMSVYFSTLLAIIGAGLKIYLFMT